MFSKIAQFSRSPWYWLALLLLGLGMEGVALYYQHVLDLLPCYLCIHVRIWTLGIIVVSLLALLVRNLKGMNIIMSILSIGVFSGLFERSWLLLGVEKGTVFGSCAMSAGLPAWFALDEWFPQVFKVMASCGITPRLWFDITMAEGLVAMSISLLVLGTLLLLAQLVHGLLQFRQKKGLS